MSSSTCLVQTKSIRFVIKFKTLVLSHHITSLVREHNMIYLNKTFNHKTSIAAQAKNLYSGSMFNRAIAFSF